MLWVLSDKDAASICSEVPSYALSHRMCNEFEPRSGQSQCICLHEDIPGQVCDSCWHRPVRWRPIPEAAPGQSTQRHPPAERLLAHARSPCASGQAALEAPAYPPPLCHHAMPYFCCLGKLVQKALACAQRQPAAARRPEGFYCGTTKHCRALRQDAYCSLTYKTRVRRFVREVSRPESRR